MSILLKKSAAVLLALSALTAASAARADSLLSDGDRAQLAAWLGGGELTLTNIYTKVVGDTAASFHAAVDGKGPTFSVMQAMDDQGKTWLVGGYNPQSWSSKGGYNMTPEQQDRTAFIFNLTSGVMRLQAPTSFAVDSAGAYQTFNDPAYGPTFGIGHDLYVGQDLTQGLSVLYSYAGTDPVSGGFHTSLLDGSPYPSKPNAIIGQMEIFTFSLTPVPEPSAALMLVGGLAALVLATRRRRHCSRL